MTEKTIHQNDDALRVFGPNVDDDFFDSNHVTGQKPKVVGPITGIMTLAVCCECQTLKYNLACHIASLDVIYNLGTSGFVFKKLARRLTLLLLASELLLLIKIFFVFLA